MNLSTAANLFTIPAACMFMSCLPALVEPRGPANPIMIDNRFVIPMSRNETPTGDRPLMAILIDDTGESIDQIEPFLALPLDLSFSVLPSAPRSTEVARALVLMGRDVLVHLPMEPSDPAMMTTPGFLKADMDEPALARGLSEALALVPGAAGANNHMGSRFTRDATRMEVVILALKSRGLYFIDSRTDPGTAGRSVAEKVGIPFLVRDVFLDHEPGEAAAASKMEELVAIARAKGIALGIGHPRPETADVLRRYARAPDPGVACVTVSRLIAHRAGRAAPAP